MVLGRAGIKSNRLQKKGGMGLKRLRDRTLFLVIALYMLCLPIPSLAGTKVLLTQAQARNFALGFCSGPDVALCTDKDRCSVIRQDDLWRCDITTGDAGCVSLLFDVSAGSFNCSATVILPLRLTAYPWHPAFPPCPKRNPTRSTPYVTGCFRAISGVRETSSDARTEHTLWLATAFIQR